MNSVSSSLTRTLLKTAEESGIEIEKLMAAIGMDSSVLNDPDGRIPTDTHNRAWELAIEAAGNIPLGLRYIDHIQPATFHILGYLILTCANLKDAIEYFIRYETLVNDKHETSLETNGADTHIVYAIDGAFKKFHISIIEATLGGMVNFGQWLCGEGFVPREVHFIYEQPAYIAEYKNIFPCPVLFSQPENRIVFDRSMLDLPLRFADSQMLGVFRKQVEKLHAELSTNGSLGDQILQYFSKTLFNGDPGIEKVSDHFRMSSRTLQRKLKKEGLSYWEILEGFRKKSALRYLQDKNIAIYDIAFLLGFTDLSSFHRAFKRWYGMPPGEYRNKL